MADGYSFHVSWYATGLRHDDLNAALEQVSEIAGRYGLDLRVVNPDVDPQFGFMTLDHDGKIADVPNLIILSASAPDQRSWRSDELKRTIFGHYLLEGLKGAADEKSPGTSTDPSRSRVGGSMLTELGRMLT